MNRNIRKKLSARKKLVIVLSLALIGCIFGLIYATPSGTILFGPSGTAPAIATVEKPGANGPCGEKPGWPDNVIGGTGGSIDNGDLFVIDTDNSFNNGLWIQVELVNRGDINQKYNSFTENLGVYYFDNYSPTASGEWHKIGKTENTMITLVGGPATFHISRTNAENAIAIVLESGHYFAKENYSSYPDPINYLTIEEAAYT